MHRLDAGVLVRIVAESAPAGTVVHAVAEEGIPTREIAGWSPAQPGLLADLDAGHCVDAAPHSTAG